MRKMCVEKSRPETHVFSHGGKSCVGCAKLELYAFEMGVFLQLSTLAPNSYLSTESVGGCG